MERRTVVNLVLTGIAIASFFLVYAGGPEGRDQPWTYPAILSTLPLFYFVAATRLRHDGFSLGAIYIAVLFELAIYMGWTHSPQLEEHRLLWTATLMPVIFILLVVLFNYLQREA